MLETPEALARRVEELAQQAQGLEARLREADDDARRRIEELEAELRLVQYKFPRGPGTKIRDIRQGHLHPTVKRETHITLAHSVSGVAFSS